MTDDCFDNGDSRGDLKDAWMSGKVVVAHPTRVAQADQIAADERIERVTLNRFVPLTRVYILDLDELTKLPEEGFLHGRSDS